MKKSIVYIVQKNKGKRVASLTKMIPQHAGKKAIMQSIKSYIVKNKTKMATKDKSKSPLIPRMM